MSELGQKIIQATREIASERFDYVYDGDECVYVHHGQPSCLLGHALWELELIDSSLEYSRNNKVDINELLHNLDCQLDDDEHEWLVSAQDSQDNKYAWGRSVELADRYIRVSSRDSD